nr:MAG TPA: hypothetical protein [Caudoviricetes sp.]
MSDKCQISIFHAALKSLRTALRLFVAGICPNFCHIPWMASLLKIGPVMPSRIVSSSVLKMENLFRRRHLRFPVNMLFI